MLTLSSVELQARTLILVMFSFVFALFLRLQTGMRGAFGKPQGTVARVHIGQVIMSVRTKAQNKEHVVEALRRAKFKFPGRQKVNRPRARASAVVNLS